MRDPANYFVVPAGGSVLESVHELPDAARGLAPGAAPLWDRLSFASLATSPGSSLQSAPQAPLTVERIEAELARFDPTELASAATRAAGVQVWASRLGYDGLVVVSSSPVVATEGAELTIDDPTMAVVSLRTRAAVALENGWVFRFERVGGTVEVTAWRRPGRAPELPPTDVLLRHAANLEPDLRATVDTLIDAGAAETIVAAGAVMMRHGPDPEAEDAIRRLVATGVFVPPRHWALEWVASFSSGVVRSVTSGAQHWVGELADNVESTAVDDVSRWLTLAEEREQLEALVSLLGVCGHDAGVAALLDEIDGVASVRGAILGTEEPSPLLDRAASLRNDVWWTLGGVCDLERDEG